MTGIRNAPKPCRDCLHLDTIDGPNGNSLFRICNFFHKECEASVIDCHLAVKYELLIADYDRLLEFDKNKARVR